MAPDTDVSGRHDRSAGRGHALDPTGIRTSPHSRPAGFSVGYEDYEVWLDPADTDSYSIERVSHHRLSELFSEEQWETIFYDDMKDTPKPSFFSDEEWNRFLWTTDEFEEKLSDVENHNEDIPESEERMLEEIWLTCKKVLANEEKSKDVVANEFILQNDDDTSGEMGNEVDQSNQLSRIRLPTSDETETESVFYDSDNISHDRVGCDDEHRPSAMTTMTNEGTFSEKNIDPPDDKKDISSPATTVSANIKHSTSRDRLCR